MKIYHIEIGTWAGYNVICRESFPYEWKYFVDKEATDPRLNDANRKPLELREVGRLRVIFGNKVYQKTMQWRSG